MNLLVHITAGNVFFNNLWVRELEVDKLSIETNVNIYHIWKCTNLNRKFCEDFSL